MDAADTSPPAEAAAAPMPKRIMQTWKSRDVLPERFRAWSDTVKAHNPGFAYELTDDADNRAFMQRHFPWFLPRYDAYPREIQRVDAYRYFWLFLHGGFYLDLDVECLRPLDRYLSAGDVVLGRMGTDQRFGHAIPNAAMASRPRQDFWLFVMARLLARMDLTAGPEVTTGPVLLKGAVDRWNADPAAARAAAGRIVAKLDSGMRDTVCRTGTLTLLPSVEWYPLNWANPERSTKLRQALGPWPRPAGRARAVFPRSGLVSYWSGSWKEKPPPASPA